MKPLIFFLALLVLALIAQVVLRAIGRARHAQGIWPFTVKKPLTRVEQILYYRLLQSLPDLVVLAQVPMSGVLRVKKGQTWNEWHARISQLSLDYVVCERDFTIVAAIELDDKSHDSGTRTKDDATKARALASAGVPLVRWRVTALPESETIRTVIEEIRADRPVDALDITIAREEPSLNASRIDASNDPMMINEETRK